MELLQLMLLVMPVLLTTAGPGTPTGLRVFYSSENNIWLKWDDMGAGFTYNIIYYTNPQNKTYINGISSSEKQVHPLTTYTDYWFSVAAVDSTGQVGQYSPELHAKTKRTGPTDVYTRTIDEHTLEVTWSADSRAESFSILYFTPYTPSFVPEDSYPWLRRRVTNIPGHARRAYMRNLLSATLHVITVVQVILGEESAMSQADSAPTKPYPPSGLRFSGPQTIEWDSIGLRGHVVYVVEYVFGYDWTNPQAITVGDNNITFAFQLRHYTFRVAARAYGTALGDYSEVLSDCPPCVNVCGILPDGYYPSCEPLCRKYVTCAAGVTYAGRECPAGLVWDDYLKRCEYETTSPCWGIAHSCS